MKKAQSSEILDTTVRFSKPYSYLIHIASSKIFLGFIFAWFIFQAVYIAFSTKYGIPPDETYHLGLINLYAQRSWLPFISNQTGFFTLGEVTRTPGYLYHYLLSFPFRLIPAGSEVLVLRLFNVGISTLTMVGFVAFMKELKLPPAVRNLSLMALSGTLMFVFLSASINYDNLVNLLAILGFMQLVRLWRKPTLNTVMVFLIIIAAGVLTKLAFLPLALMLVAAALVGRGRKIISVIRNWRLSIRATSAKLILISLTILSLLVGERYVYNFWKYHTPLPSCAIVHSVEDCQASAIFKRNNALIAHPAPLNLGPLEFTVRWAWSMKAKIYGVMGHKAFHDGGLVKTATFAYLALGMVAIARGLKWREKNLVMLLSIGLGYALILLFQNYLTYRRSGLYGLALQGRYLFPVLPVLYAIANKYIWEMLGEGLRTFFIIALTTLFVLAGLPMYISYTNPSWYNTSFIGINAHLKTTLSSLYN